MIDVEPSWTDGLLSPYILVIAVAATVASAALLLWNEWHR